MSHGFRTGSAGWWQCHRVAVRWGRRPEHLGAGPAGPLSPWTQSPSPASLPGPTWSSAQRGGSGPFPSRGRVFSWSFQCGVPSEHRSHSLPRGMGRGLRLHFLVGEQKVPEPFVRWKMLPVSWKRPPAGGLLGDAAPSPRPTRSSSSREGSFTPPPSSANLQGLLPLSEAHAFAAGKGQVPQPPHVLPSITTSPS